jgi:hypothetical protein
MEPLLSLLFRSICMEEGASEEEGRTIFLQLLTRRGALVRSERGLMHEEARRRAHAFMVRDFPFQSQFIFCGQICTEGGAWVEMTGSYLVANLLGGFQL